MFGNEDEEDIIQNSYDEGYDEGQGNTGFFNFSKKINHNNELRTVSYRKGFKEGQADLEKEVDESLAEHDTDGFLDDGDAY